MCRASSEISDQCWLNSVVKFVGSSEIEYAMGHFQKSEYVYLLSSEFA